MKEEIRRFLGLGVVAFLVYLAVCYWPWLTGFAGAVLSAAQPLILGCIIAYILGILMDQCEKLWFPKSRLTVVQRTRPFICMLLSFVIIVAVVALLIKLVVPQLLACVQLLLKEIPLLFNRCVAWLQSQENLLPNIQTALENASIDADEMLRRVIVYLTNGASGLMTGAVNTATSIIASIPSMVMMFIFSIYLLLGRHSLKRQINRLMDVYMNPDLCRGIRYVLGVANQTFRSFIVGQVTEALILGVLCTAGMLLLRLPYATMTGAVVGFTALIPIMGAYIGTFVGAFMIFTVNPIQAVVFVVFLLILQQIEGNLIYPHTVGSSIGLPGIWVLASVTVFGGLFGIAGMLIGVPLTATAYRLLKNDLRRRTAQ
ncbi:MAG: AI-2E family transporter [Clostridia bacterium]|nr:AI-2E family transporter [Clostridia bacterium]